MSLTIGKLAKKFSLSRSTLLYYSSIGLLKPDGHSKGQYRHYGSLEQRRLKEICRYRQAGISLRKIRKILDSPESSFTAALKERFDDLSEEIAKLHEQQRIIAELLDNKEILQQSGMMTKKLWSSLLQHAGFDDNDMRKWHINFEQMAPEKHLEFLKHLQIPEDEIEAIRGWREEQEDKG